MHAKDPCKAKYQYFVSKRDKVGFDHYDDPKVFMEHSNDMQDVYKNIADMINNKKLNPIVTELFTRGRKISIYTISITQSYVKVPKDVRLNSTHFFIMKIPNKREPQQIALNHSSDINFKDFMKIYKKCTAEPYSFLVNDTDLPSDNTLRFRKNLLE